MTIWILVIMNTIHGGIDHIPFVDKEGCVAAAILVEAQSHAIRAVCIPQEGFL